MSKERHEDSTVEQQGAAGNGDGEAEYGGEKSGPQHMSCVALQSEAAGRL